MASEMRMNSRCSTGLQFAAAALVVFAATACDSPRTARMDAGGAHATDDLRRVPVAQLLEWMPPDPWATHGEEPELEPIAAELQRRARSGSMSADEWCAALRASDVIHTRAQWPTGERLALWIREPAWLGNTKITVWAIEPDLGLVIADNRSPNLCGNGRMGDLARQRKLVLDALPLGMTQVRLEVRIDQDKSWAIDRDQQGKLVLRDDPLVMLWQGPFDLAVRAVPLENKIMTEVSSANVTESVRAAISVQRSRAKDSGSGLQVFVGGDYERLPDLRGVGLSVDLELWREMALVARGQLVVENGLSFGGRDKGFHGSCTFTGAPIAIIEAEPDLSKWELRIAGSPEGLLTDWESDRWWSGRLAIPLTEVVGR